MVTWCFSCMGTGRSSGRGRNSVPGVLTCAGLIRKALAAALSGLDGIVGVLNAAGTTRKPKACHPGKHEVLATTTGDQDPTGIDLCPRSVLNRSTIFWAVVTARGWTSRDWGGCPVRCASFAAEPSR